jgi:hypothetical protein
MAGGAWVAGIKFIHQQRNTHRTTTRIKENIMKSTFKNTVNKDNAGAFILLSAMLFTIAAAFTSINVEAKAAVSAAAPAKPTAAATTTNTPKIETLVVTATRLK